MSIQMKSSGTLIIHALSLAQHLILLSSIKMHRQLVPAAAPEARVDLQDQQVLPVQQDLLGSELPDRKDQPGISVRQDLQVAQRDLLVLLERLDQLEQLDLVVQDRPDQQDQKV